MEFFECEGVFWLADEPENMVPGRLEYRGSKGVDLDLLGSFEDVTTLTSQTRAPVLINGVAEGKKWTLYDSHVSKKTLNTPGIFRVIYNSPMVVAGGEFCDKSGFDKFCGVDLQMEYLHDWLGRSGFEMEINTKKGNKDQINLVDFNVTCKPLSNEYITTSRGNVITKFLYTTKGEGTDNIFSELHLKQMCSLGFKWNSTVDLFEIVTYSKYFHNLLTICIGVPPKIRKINILKDSTQIPFELYTSSWSSSLRETVVHPLNRIFTLNSFGGLEALTRWLEVSQKYAIAIDALLSHKHVPDLYMENKFINIMIAAEAFVRIREGLRGRLKLEYILNVLVKCADDFFVRIVGNIKRWISQTVRMRHNITHTSSLNRVNVISLDLLTDSSYWLVVICLLKECNISNLVFENLLSIQEIKNLSSRFRS